jgi:hypothetical protein
MFGAFPGAGVDHRGQLGVDQRLIHRLSCGPDPVLNPNDLHGSSTSALSTAIVVRFVSGSICRKNSLTVARWPPTSSSTRRTAARTTPPHGTSLVFAQPNAEHVHEQFEVIATVLGKQLPKVEQMLRDAREDLLAFIGFPVSHWKDIWSTNPLSRLDREVERRTDGRGLPQPARVAPPGRRRAGRSPQRVAGHRCTPLPVRAVDGQVGREDDRGGGQARTHDGMLRTLTRTVSRNSTTQRDVTRQAADRSSHVTRSSSFELPPGASSYEGTSPGIDAMIRAESQTTWRRSARIFYLGDDLSVPTGHLSVGNPQPAQQPVDQHLLTRTQPRPQRSAAAGLTGTARAWDSAQAACTPPRPERPGTMCLHGLPLIAW